MRLFLHEGMEIDVYEDDINEKGEPDKLIASGTVERNIVEGWATVIKWCCRINNDGIRHESDLHPRSPITSATAHFVEHLLSKFPDLQPIDDSHMADNGELLPHVFMGSVTRFVVASTL